MKAATGAGAIPYLMRDLTRCRIGLTAPEENALIRLAQNGDKAARDRVVEGVLPFCLRQAKRHYATRTRDCYELEDAFQWATMGILRAIRTYDPARGVRFLTYAGHFVRKHMQYNSIRAKATVRVPSHVYGRASKGDLAYEALLAKALTARSIDEVDEEGAPILEIADPRAVDPAAGLEAEDTAAKQGKQLAWLNETLDQFPPKEALVIRRRMGGLTLDDVAAELGVSRERVRQVEKRAMRRLVIAAGKPKLDLSWKRAADGAVRELVGLAHPPQSDRASLVKERRRRMRDAAVEFLAAEHGEGEFAASPSLLAEHCGCSHSTAQRILADLLRTGRMVLTHRGGPGRGNPSRYRLAAPA
jgi:RNA polymerase sigma factor (sigma-70 family)